MVGFHDPATGNSILLEGANTHRGKVLARTGLGLVIVGVGLQLWAVLG